MSNTIQIKRGRAAPEKDQLAPYELGYSTNKKALYIRDDENDEVIRVGSGEGGTGEDGKSAYEIAVDNGFEGTEQEWLESLKGEPGEPGEPGEQGPQGLAGADGPQGPAGYTPEKGVDYWTPEDQQTIVNEFQAVSYGAQSLSAAQKAQARKNIEDIPTFDTFAEALNKITSSTTRFRTRGFYIPYDGADCEYAVQTTANNTYIQYGDLAISPAYLINTNMRTIYVKHYGIRPGPITQLNGEWLGWDANIAEANSVIFDKLIPSLGNGFTLEFEAGHFFFTRSIGCTKAINFKGSASQVCAQYAQSSPVNFGTLLHFPYVHKATVKAEGQDTGFYAALYLYTGIVQDIGIMGPDHNNFNIHINRDISPTITATLPLTNGETTTKTLETFEAIEKEISDEGKEIIDTYGIYFYDGNGGNVQNTRMVGFMCGIYSPTQNNVIADCYIRTAKIGIIIHHDNKVRGIQLWNVIVGIQMRATLGSATDIRGDSIGKHLIECWEGKCIMSNIDADYCLGSIIHYGCNDNNVRWMHLGQATTVMGRCATRYPLLRNINTQNDTTIVQDAPYTSDIEFDFAGKDYEYCSFISIAPGSQVFGGYLDLINVKTNPYDKNYPTGDTAVRYVHSNAILCIGGAGDGISQRNSSVNNLIIKCFVPSYANADYIANQMVYSQTELGLIDNNGKEISPYVGNAFNNYISDFDGNTFENIVLITPQGQITSTRKIKIDNGTRKVEFLSDIYSKIDETNDSLSTAISKVNAFEEILTLSEITPATANINLNDEVQADYGTQYGEYQIPLYDTKTQTWPDNAGELLPRPTAPWAENYTLIASKELIPVQGGSTIGWLSTSWPYVLQEGEENATTAPWSYPVHIIEYDKDKKLVKEAHPTLNGRWPMITNFGTKIISPTVEHTIYQTLNEKTRYVRWYLIYPTADCANRCKDENGLWNLKIAIYYKEQIETFLAQYNASTIWDEKPYSFVPELYIPYEGARKYVVGGNNIRLSDSSGKIYMLTVSDSGILGVQQVSE